MIELKTARDLMQITGCDSLGEALDWIAGENPLKPDTDPHCLLLSVLRLPDDSPHQEEAIKTLVRTVVASDLDSAAFLLETDKIKPPSRFDESLAVLAGECPSGGLDSVNEKALIAAQRRDSFVIEAFCSLGGMTYRELTQRIDGMAPSSEGHLVPSQLRAAFREVDKIIAGPDDSSIEGAVPVVPIELLTHPKPSWTAIEEMRVNGVSLGSLLAQREVGGAWLSHRNRTANLLGPILANRLCEELDSLSIPYERSTLLGGSCPPADLAKLAGCDRRVGIVVRSSSGSPFHGVVFSIARDGGTARANANRLINMTHSEDVPLSIVVAGPGWASRHETAKLARVFGGRIYSDRSITRLASSVREEMKQRGEFNADSE
jgi:hypothetical protein